MRFELDRLPILLSGRKPLDIRDAAGTSLRVLRGRVWITQEGSPDDVFVESGGRYTFACDGRAVVSAETGRATIAFDAPLRIEGRSSLTDRLRRLLSMRRAGRPTIRSIVGVG